MKFISFINLNFSKSIVIMLICVGNVCALLGKEEWLDCLLRYIQKDSKKFQTVILIDGDTENGYSVASGLVREISRSAPSKVINYRKATFAKVKELVNNKNILHLRKTSLLITIQFVTEELYLSKAYDVIEILNELCERKSRPKCLMIFLTKEKISSHKKLLRNVWNKKFLDFTVLEITEKRYTNESLFKNNHRNFATIHHYNPFTQTYYRKRYSSGVELFPNKLRNLNGFKLKVGMVHYPPSLYVKRNESGYPVQFFGAHASVVNALSKAMNFRMQKTSSKTQGWGVVSSNISETTGIFRQLSYNKIQFSVNAADITPWAGNITENSRFLTDFCRFPIIPVLKTETLHLTYLRNYLYAGVLLFSLTIIPILIAQIFKFSKEIFSPLYVFEAVLGLSTPDSPTKATERIIFGFTLFSFFISSSVINAVFTDVKFIKESTFEINTLEDLKNAGLRLMLDQSTAYGLQVTEHDNTLQALLNESIITLSSTKCISYLVEYKNVTCVLTDIYARLILREMNIKNTDQVMKVGKPCFRKALAGIMFEPGSPYLAQINRLIERISQSGLLIKWNDLSYISSKGKNQELEFDDSSVHIMPSLLVVIVTGSVLSFVTFALEVTFNSMIKIG